MKPIFFRPLPEDEANINELRKRYGVKSPSEIVRLSLTIARKEAVSSE